MPPLQSLLLTIILIFPKNKCFRTGADFHDEYAFRNEHSVGLVDCVQSGGGVDPAGIHHDTWINVSGSFPFRAEMATIEETY